MFGKLVYTWSNILHKNASAGTKLALSHEGSSWGSDSAADCTVLYYLVVTSAGYYYNVPGSSFNPFWQCCVGDKYRIKVNDDQKPKRGEPIGIVSSPTRDGFQDGANDGIWYEYKDIG